MIKTYLRRATTALLVGSVGLTGACALLGEPAFVAPLREAHPDVPSTVIAQRGDSVYGIARLYRLPVRALIAANKLTPPFSLRLGQILTLPHSQWHTVNHGDTVYNIARRYRVEVPTLIRANDIKSPYVIILGQHLSIPSANAAPPTTISSVKDSGGQAKQQDSHNNPKKIPVVANGGKSDDPNPQPTARQEKTYSSPLIPKPPPRSGQPLLWPVTGKVVTKFGSLGDGLQNDGINIAVDKGTPVRAADNGVVVYVGNEMKGFGNLLLIKHAGGWMTAYAHQETITVKRGQKVSRGDVVGKSGSTGSAPFPQLHFEVRQGTKAVDPLTYLASA